MKQLRRSTQFDEEFAYWVKINHKNADKIVKILNNICKDSFFNFNKGEKLKYHPNRYACRIDRKNRFIYEKTGDSIKLISCRGHYEDK